MEEISPHQGPPRAPSFMYCSIQIRFFHVTKDLKCSGSFMVSPMLISVVLIIVIWPVLSLETVASTYNKSKVVARARLKMTY